MSEQSREADRLINRTLLTPPAGGGDATQAKDGWSPKLEVGGMAKWTLGQVELAKWTGRRNQIGRLLDQTMVPWSRKQVS